MGKKSVYSVGTGKISMFKRWRYYAGQWKKAKEGGNLAAIRYYRKQMIRNMPRPRYGIYKLKARR